ncbi:MAG TPA: sulfotransferase [Gammaproteobacteria bacterium]|nr:sulfotransferase [Gammaproteobacteria bacterium]
MPETGAQELCRGVYRLLDQGDIRRAGPACERLVAEFPAFAPGWAAFSELWQRCREADRAAHCAETACRLAPRSAAYRAQLARCELLRGQSRRATALAEQALGLGGADHATLDTIGNVFSRAGEQARALEVFRAALELAPDNPAAIYNLATSLRFHGRVGEAERLFERLIELDPDDHEAVHSRSVLRRQTEESNHVAELRRRLEAGRDWRALSHYAYALGKELDDLDRPADAFRAFSHGARLIHEHLPSGLETERAHIGAVVRALRGGLLEKPGSGHPSAEPVFVIGLPRTGSTLVERILGSHSQVFAAGELHNFQVEARRLTGARTVAEAFQAVLASPDRFDFARLGAAYLESTRPRTGRTARFIDKLPRNDLWAGLIHRALPGARFILTTRHPADACYAMFRTLFRSGYPFTYDLQTLGHYYRAHQVLVQALKDTLPPGSLLEVAYEDLVGDPERHARRMTEFCGLDWEPACLAFHQREEAVVTASAHQVRQPIYSSSVGRWRKLERELAPLLRALEEEHGDPLAAAGEAGGR